VQFAYIRVRQSDGTWSTRLTVTKQPRGDNRTQAVRFISEAAAAQQFPVEFAHFRDTGEMPTQGTPLSDLPGISMAQIGLLYVHGVRSVEDLCALSQDQVNIIGRDAIHAHKVALRWHERAAGADDVTEAAKREAALEAALMETQRQLDEAKRAALEAAAQVKVLSQIVPQKQNQMAPGMVAAEALGGAIAVDGQEVVARAGVEDPFLSAGGMADGNEDLGLSVTPEDPLGLSAQKPRKGG
jgi:hypothetical protein